MIHEIQKANYKNFSFNTLRCLSTAILSNFQIFCLEFLIFLQSELQARSMAWRMFRLSAILYAFNEETLSGIEPDTSLLSPSS